MAGGGLSVRGVCPGGGCGGDRVGWHPRVLRHVDASGQRCASTARRNNPANPSHVRDVWGWTRCISRTHSDPMLSRPVRDVPGLPPGDAGCVHCHGRAAIRAPAAVGQCAISCGDCEGGCVGGGCFWQRLLRAWRLLQQSCTAVDTAGPAAGATACNHTQSRRIPTNLADAISPSALPTNASPLLTPHHPMCPGREAPRLSSSVPSSRCYCARCTAPQPSVRTGGPDA